MTSDSPPLRDLLVRFFPALVITSVAKHSGQRVVYFCYFEPPSNRNGTAPGQENWHNWGDVVVKISSGIDPQSIAYMQMEISVLNDLKSPSFPRLHYNELFTEDPETGARLLEKLFVTIEERKQAEPLTDCVARFNTEDAVVDLLLKLVNALVLLWNHDRKLVHRDLKPDNLLITAQLEVVVIDLGIVRETGAAGITATHAPHGPLSPMYTSPEQIKNDKRNISFKSDFFSLGTIAYELLSGKHPFVRIIPPQVHDLMDSVPNYIPPRLDSICACSQQFAQIIEMMMQKEPYRRHRTPEALIQALNNLKGSHQ